MTSREVIIGQTVALEIEIRDGTGALIDADSIPEVEIKDSHSTVRRTMSSTDVSRVSLGKYLLNYIAPMTGYVGTWADKWRVYLSGERTDATLSFVVLSAAAAITAAGAEIGDPSTLEYSNEEIIGINILMAELKARLNNDVRVETTDAYGNIEYVECAIFTNDELKWFLECSLQEFNGFPHVTDYRFNDEVIYRRYSFVITEGAFILATAAKMLIEAGREFSINDNGIQFTPPPLSATLNNQLSAFVTAHRELVKQIKWSIKPHPIGFGSFRILGFSPAYLRLRHLRQRRII